MERSRSEVHRLTVIIGLILAAAITRLLPHPPNMTPVTAVSLFGGALLPSPWRFALPLLVMGLSDVALGLRAGDWSITFHPTLPVVYATFLAIALGGGAFLRRWLTLGRTLGAAFAGSVLFFITTNFAVWALTELYPPTLEGLVACYVAALPFFRNSLLGDIGYTVLLFGLYSAGARVWKYELLPRQIAQRD
jgi:hypothetical protein